MQHAGLVYSVVLAPLKEGVVQVGQVGDNALALGLAQQHVVPLAQAIAPGGPLSVGVAIQDIVISLQVRRCQGSYCAACSEVRNPGSNTSDF